MLLRTYDANTLVCEEGKECIFWTIFFLWHNNITPPHICQNNVLQNIICSPKLLKRLLSKNVRQSPNRLKINFSFGNSENVNFIVFSVITIQMFCKLLSALSRIHPSLGRARGEYPEGQQNMEKQMKVKSFNPKTGENKKLPYIHPYAKFLMNIEVWRLPNS